MFSRFELEFLLEALEVIQDLPVGFDAIFGEDYSTHESGIELISKIKKLLDENNI